MITGLAYTSHQVEDLDRAREFYGGLLGLKSSGPYDGTWEEYELKDGTAFAVYKVSKITPSYFKKHKISASIAFEVTNIEKMCKKLREAGVNILQEPENNGGHCKTAYLSDPDDNIVTLHELLEK